jgi:fucose permease
MRRVLDLRADAFGLLLSISLGVGILGSLAAGWLADKGYLKHAFWGGFVCLLFSYAVCALPPAYATYLMAFAFLGLANSGLLTLTSVAVARAYPDGARKALTFAMILHSIPGVIGPPLWEILLNHSESAVGTAGALRIVFFTALGVCAVAAVVFTAFPLSESVTEEKKPAAQGTGEAGTVWGPPLLIVCIFAALHAGAYNSMYSWIPEFTKRTFAPNPFPVSWILSGVSLSYIAGRIILLRVPDRLPDLKLIIAASAIGSVLFAVAFASPNQYLLGVLCLIGGLILSVNWPSIISHTAYLFPHASGKAVAFASASAGAMSFVIPPAMGFVAEKTGSLVAGMLLPPLMVAVLSVGAFVWRIRLRRIAAES